MWLPLHVEFLLCHTPDTSLATFYNPLLGEPEKDGKKVTTKAVYHTESAQLLSGIQAPPPPPEQQQQQLYL